MAEVPPNPSSTGPGRSSKPRHRKSKRMSGNLAVDQYTVLRGLSLDQLHDTTAVPLIPESAENQPASGFDSKDLPLFMERIDSSINGHKFWCRICDAKCNSVLNMKQHLGGKRHFVMLLANAVQKNRDSLKKDKDNIEVSVRPAQGQALTVSDTDDIELVISERKSSGAENTIIFEVSNKSEVPIVLKRCDLLQLIFSSLFKLSENKSQDIPPGGKIEIKLKARSPHLGSYSTRIAFFLMPAGDPNMTIHIVRTVTVRYGHPDVADLGPTAPYKRPPRVDVHNRGVLIEDGVPLKESLESYDRLERIVTLDQYRMPADLKSAVNHGLKEDPAKATNDKTVKKYRQLLSSKLSYENYKEKFSALLHAEEAQQEVDIRKYDLHAVHLDGYTQNKKLLKLRVPGLSENRPSVLRGDQVLMRVLKPDGKPEELEYRGYVHEVLLHEICLQFSAKFHSNWIQAMKFNVRFVINRYCERLQHRAVRLAIDSKLRSFLFPAADTVCKIPIVRPVDTPIKFYNNLIEGNKQQALAVKHILSGSSRPAPFLVFGPPGTGKTVTIVEAMKQVYKCFPEARILACCPSNNSADHMTQRLLDHIPRQSLLRLNAACRTRSTIPENIRDRCNYERSTHHVEFPSTRELKEYRIIVSTLITAGRLVSASFPVGYFTHIFIDEAGQACEPECIIPVAGILESDIPMKEGGQVVLAGDPEQLGAVLRSPIAVTSGLGVSLLERLMKQVAVYMRRSPESKSQDDGPYNDALLVKLLRNYRSHPAILQVPNEMFYDKELEVHADELLRQSLCNWEGLPKSGFPVIFHGVVGKEQREEKSPSYFNTDEINIIRDYIERLIEGGKGIKVEPKDIGVIAPYRKQVEKFKQLFRKKDWKDIKVGSVEEFQGLERRVIIISTVRSSADQLAVDFHFKLGFLKNPKRFNVAITRSMALLIMVGNPFILTKDDHWGKMLRYSIDEGGYTGCDFKPDVAPDGKGDDEVGREGDGGPLGGSDLAYSEIIKQFADLGLNTKSLGVSEADKVGISLTTLALEPAWGGADRI